MRKKKLVTINLTKEILNWIDKQIENRKFASRSHAIEYIVAKFKKKGEKE